MKLSPELRLAKLEEQQLRTISKTTDKEVEYRRSRLNTNLMVGNDGSFYYIKPFTKRQLGLKYGTKMYTKKGYPICMEVCIGYTYEDGKKRCIIKNVGSIVLDAFGVEQTKDDEGILRTEVDHINRNPFDNRLDNLRWVTRKENIANAAHNGGGWTPTARAKALKSRNEIARNKGFDSWGDYMNYCRLNKGL